MQRNQYNMRPLTAETVNEAIGRATFNPAYRHLHAVKDLGQVLRRHKIRIPTSVATEHILNLLESMQQLKPTGDESESLYASLLRTLLERAGTLGPTKALVQLMLELKRSHSEIYFVNVLLKLILARGAKVNGPSSVVRDDAISFTPDRAPRWALTPLHIAAEYGDAETVRLLINRGANVNARTRHEVFQGGMDGKYINTANVYTEPPIGVGRTPLHEAIRAMNVSTIKQLLASKSVIVNAADPMGTTPLHLAVIYGFSSNSPNSRPHGSDVVRMLMKAGANPFKKMKIADQFGDTSTYTVIELFDIPKIRRSIPGAVRDMIMAPSRVAARKHLNAALPNDLVQNILHRAGMTSVSEYNPLMSEQIRLDRLALNKMKAKRKRSRKNATGIKRPRAVTRSQTR